MAVTHKTAIKIYEQTNRLPLIDAAAKAAGCSRAALYRHAMRLYLARKGTNNAAEQSRPNDTQPD